MGMIGRPIGIEAAPSLDGKADGSVPARARLYRGVVVVASAAVDVLADAEDGSGVKSGNPSVGDSGMFSRSGVELPLVGGPPQGFCASPERPS